ncbi:CaiB/BaiF CoA transferase family protein [Sciscionella sediminilitoris]|uniref:CaiB/BaiF CoA transferase family protein n=1 Tax=Sciscionella sediminilitoris TaxID=1445613 RepID=UPI0004DF4484|nr:CaiB/BaiF CoA-transferase family protein [Sciscionella sp. SE31]
MLDGICVVALEQAVAAPFASRQLADLGARVIKVERPDTGDFARAYDTTVHGQSSHFVWLNGGKESICLDLKDAGERAVLDALLDRADVFLANLAPGALDRLGLGAQTLRERYPRLVGCTISGYGQDGPYRAKKAYDLLVQCEAGLLSITGSEDSPAKAGIAVADIAAGMYAYSGGLAALFRRERTGRGEVFEVAMLDALAEWMGFPHLFAGYGGSPPPRNGARHASISPYGPYRVGDGGTVFIGVQNQREWRLLCERVLGDPGLAEDPRFAANTDRVRADAELTEVLEAALAGLDTGRVVALLDEVGIANALMRDLASFAAHPQLSARSRWASLSTPHGAVDIVRPPGTGPDWQPGAVPELDAHGAAIRAELGLSR